jgi:hypothetical protein
MSNEPAYTNAVFATDRLLAGPKSRQSLTSFKRPSGIAIWADTLGSTVRMPIIRVEPENDAEGPAPFRCGFGC